MSSAFKALSNDPIMRCAIKLQKSWLSKGQTLTLETRLGRP
jgi:hypothetical protein